MGSRMEHCYSKASSNRCLDCEEGYGLFGDYDDKGYSQCIKCSKYCNYCFENKCIQCRCGYKNHPNNTFECIYDREFKKEVGNSDTNISCFEANNFIRVNITLLLLIIIIIFKLH